MISSKQKITSKRQKLSEKKKIAETVRDWVTDNKKVFWKYEVSCFYKSYIIRMNNLPNPSPEDIMISSNNRLLNSQQKKQLSVAVTNTCADIELMSDSSLDVQIDFVDGAVKIGII